MPDRTINYTAINKNAVANLKYIDDQLIKAGYGYIQRLAILGNVQRESSGNPLAISSNGLWHGIIQWDKDRYRIQSNNAQEELQRQTALLLKELEKKGWSGQTWKDQLAYAQSFKDSSDLKQAVDIFTRRFVRPGDINGEIAKRFNFAQLGWSEPDDTEYDLGTAKKVLPASLINAWKRDPERNHLPSGYTSKNGDWHALKSVYHPSWKEELDWQADPENLDTMLHYGEPEDYVSKFPVYKSFYQDGGSLVYRPFLPEKKTKLRNNRSLEYTSDITEESKSETFPVEAAKIFQPNWNLTYASRSPYEEGTVEYKYAGMDVGNMQELIDLMREEGISFRVTSGHRPGDRTKNGSMSHHSPGNALDITPASGQSWEDLITQMRNSDRFVAYMREHNLGILDERSQQMQARTGATGAHFHIGPDKNAILNFEYLIG